jgi:hypothetical protein
MSEGFEKLFEHQAGEGQAVQAGERLRQSLVISYQRSEACDPAETTLDQLAPRPQHKTFFAAESS